MIRYLLLLAVCFFFPQSVDGFDGTVEGRVKLGSAYVPASPSGFKDFDSEAELRLGVLGNAWKNDVWQLDYELTAEANQVDGPSEQASLRRETDIDFYRAWLRLESGGLKILALLTEL